MPPDRSLERTPKAIQSVGQRVEDDPDAASLGTSAAGRCGPGKLPRKKRGAAWGETAETRSLNEPTARLYGLPHHRPAGRSICRAAARDGR